LRYCAYRYEGFISKYCTAKQTCVKNRVNGLLPTPHDNGTRWFEVAQVLIFDIIWKDDNRIDTRSQSLSD
jgi:hypothetical protein